VNPWVLDYSVTPGPDTNNARNPATRHGPTHRAQNNPLTQRGIALLGSASYSSSPIAIDLRRSRPRLVPGSASAREGNPRESGFPRASPTIATGGDRATRECLHLLGRRTQRSLRLSPEADSVPKIAPAVPMADKPPTSVPVSSRERNSILATVGETADNTAAGAKNR
jgi:hypothetical protein